MAILRSAGVALALGASTAAFAQTTPAQTTPAPTTPAQATPAWTPNRYAPVAVRADDEYRMDMQTCRLVLTVNAEVTQDRVRLRAQSIVVQFARDANGCTETAQRMEADRDVYYVTPLEAVRANKAVYDVVGDNVVFTGDVVLTRGQNVSTSPSVAINLKTNAVTMKGGVEAVFYPAKPAQ